MSWPFETTEEDKKRAREDGYKDGLKGMDIKTNWSGREYYKGAQAGYAKYKENEARKNESSSSNRSKRSSSSKTKSNSSKSSSYSGGGYYSGGAGSDINWTPIIVVILIIGFLYYCFLGFLQLSLEKERKQKLANKQEEIRIEKERVHEFKTSLPAGLTPENKNYIEIFNQSGTIYIPYGHVKPPNATYHLYDRYLNDGKNRWEEIPISSLVQQQKPSNEWRVIIGTKYWMPFGEASRNQRTIVTWDLKQDDPQEITEDDPWAITEDY